MATETLKILMFDAAYPPPVIGGKEKQAHLLAKTLVGKGHVVHALSYKHNNNNSETVDGVKVSRVVNNILSPVFFIVYLIKKRLSFNILHIHTPSRIGKLVAFLGAMLGYKVFFKFPNEKMLDKLSIFQMFSWRILFKFTHLFIALEIGTVKKLRSLNVKEKKIFRVANGVEMYSKIKPKVEKKVNLVFVGRLVEQKRCDITIAACSVLAKKGYDFNIKIVGDGPLLTSLEKQVVALGIEGKVIFLGHINKVIDILKEADVIISSSSNEGMANVLLEAISIGLPIVSTDVGSARYQVGRFGSQFLCKVSSPECLADNLIKLIDNVDLYLEYSDFLHKRGKELFSIEQVANEYIKKYKQVS